MFLGHYAVAIGAKRAAPRSSLGTLIAAAAFLDLVWPVLVLLGLERVAGQWLVVALAAWIDSHRSALL